MLAEDKSILIKRYSDRLTVYGDDPKTLGWGNGGRDRQNLRFKILMEMGIQAHHSVLDIGCGFGDLYGFLKRNGWDNKYLGIDINSEILELAKNKYPEIEVKCLDILNEGLEYKYDFVVASGIFNERLNTGSNPHYIEAMLAKMHECCLVGTGADFLSTYVHFMAEGSFHSDPGEIIKISKKFSNKIILRMDYLPYEFMIYCFK